MKWITASDLQRWADTLTATKDLPRLIADLVRATVSSSDISELRFPNGDKGHIRGLDGYLETYKAAHPVPVGRSIWEFSVEDAILKKAQKDYDSRSSDTTLEKQNTTLVLVNLNTWDTPKKKLQSWLDKVNSEGIWKKVVMLDGVALEDWLSQCPAVAACYAREVLCSVPPTGAMSIDEYWLEFSSKYKPPITEDVLLAGRESQAQDLVRHLLEGGAGVRNYSASEAEEAVAFVIAAIRKAPLDHRNLLNSRTIILDSDSSARRFTGHQNLIYILKNKAAPLGGLLAKTSPVICCVATVEKPPACVILEQRANYQLASALSAIGSGAIPDGYGLAKACGGSITVLARLRPSGPRPRPTWYEQRELLITATLAGACSANHFDDNAVIAVLHGGDNYSNTIRQFKKQDDSPLRFYSSGWALTSGPDAFVAVGPLIGQEHLARFENALNLVFGPQYSNAYSQELKTGLASTLCYMALLHTEAEFTTNSLSPPNFVSHIVRRLLDFSNGTTTLWNMLEQLHIFSDAAPSAYISHLELLLDTALQEIINLAVTPQSTLKISLEWLAWKPEFFHRAAVLITRIALNMEPRVKEEYLESLMGLFRAVEPNTSANASQRVGSLKVLAKKFPDISWEVASSLLSSSIGVRTCEPMSLTYNAEHLPPPSLANSRQYVHSELVALALSLAGENTHRWTTLLGSMSCFSEEMFEATTAKLIATLDGASASTKTGLWNALTKEINRNLACPDATWVLRNADLDTLKSIQSDYRPISIAAQVAWLFDKSALIPQDAPCYYTETQRIRNEALREVVSRAGLDGLLELLVNTSSPATVSVALSQLSLTKDDLIDLFNKTIAHSVGSVTATGLIMHEGSSRFGREWDNLARPILNSTMLDYTQIATILLELDDSPETWDYVSSFGDDVNDYFWKNRDPKFPYGDCQHTKLVIAKYLAHNKPLAALDVACARDVELPTNMLVDILLALRKCLLETPGLSYYVGKTLDNLRAQPDITMSEVAELELEFFPLLINSHTPLVIYDLLARNPELFIDLISHLQTPNETTEHYRYAPLLLDRFLTLPNLRSVLANNNSLESWCLASQRAAAEKGLVEATDLALGKLLAYASSYSPEKTWPSESICNVLEQLTFDKNDTTDLRAGLYRGLTSEKLGEAQWEAFAADGTAFRNIADTLRGKAASIPAYPNTTHMLYELASTFDSEALKKDNHAKKQKLK